MVALAVGSLLVLVLGQFVFITPGREKGGGLYALVWLYGMAQFIAGGALTKGRRPDHHSGSFRVYSRKERSYYPISGNNYFSLKSHELRTVSAWCLIMVYVPVYNLRRLRGNPLLYELAVAEDLEKAVREKAKEEERKKLNQPVSRSADVPPFNLQTWANPPRIPFTAKQLILRIAHERYHRMTGPAEVRHYLNPGGNPDVRKLLDELLRRTSDNVPLLLDHLDRAARACYEANPKASREDALRRALAEVAVNDTRVD